MKLHANGFTLAELMATLAVSGVLLAIGVPAFRQLVESMRISAAFHGTTVSLSAARMAAVSRNQPVTVCPSADGRHCRRDRVWEDGWITFLDGSRSGNPATPGDVVEHATPALRGLAVRSTAGRHWIRFQPSGFSAGSNLSLWICTIADRREIGRVALNNGGRARIERHRAPAPCRYAP